MPATMSSCLNSCGLCGSAYQEPGARRAGTTKSRAPSGVERVSVGVSISRKSWRSSTRRAAWLTLERSTMPPRWTRATQVQVAVLEAGLLADGDVLVDRERRGRGLVEDDDVVHVDLDLAGRQVGVRGALGAQPHLARHLDDVLGAQRVRDLLAQHHLGEARGVAQVDEGDPAVIPAATHPACKGDGGAGVGGTEVSGEVGAEHNRPFVEALSIT